MKYRNALLCLILLITAVIFIACAPGSEASVSSKPAGFFHGIWHGWIAPVSLIWGLFNQEIRIYETFNTGWWYDFGFYIALLGGFGSFSLVRRKKGRS